MKLFATLFRPLAILTLALFATPLAGQSYVYPGAAWESVDPASAGYSPEKIKQMTEFLAANTAKTHAMAVVGGKVIFTYGNPAVTSGLASARKSAVAMLYGKYIDNGTADISKTVGELGIEEEVGLLEVEKKATVKDLLTCRSAIYLPSSFSKDKYYRYPPRGSDQPDTRFVYNNWGHDAAAEAFRLMTGMTIFEAFERDFAGELQMQDFSPARQRIVYDTTRSRYPHYVLVLSTRDMARLGYLMLRGGNWNGKQLVPERWVAEMITVQSDREKDMGAASGVYNYGYAWWLFDRRVKGLVYEGAYTAIGRGGQYITVIPALDMVVAFKTMPTPDESGNTKATVYRRWLDMLTAGQSFVKPIQQGHVAGEAGR